ncbi:3790_t:CDS:2, partial [Cetraspora pellucida]
NRLQGESFRQVYITTSQIEVANIQWNYNQINDVIKVEIWDVYFNILIFLVAPTKLPPPRSALLPPDQLTLDAATTDAISEVNRERISEYPSSNMVR